MIGRRLATPTLGTAHVGVVTSKTQRDAEWLLTNFVGQAYRRPVAQSELARLA